MSVNLVFYDGEGKPHSVEEIAQISKERDILATGIAEAAVKAGIYNGEVQTTGPHLLMFLDDMVEYSKHLENELEMLVKHNKALEREVLELKRVNQEQREQEKRLDKELLRNKPNAKRDEKISQHIKQIRSAKSLAYRDSQLEELIRIWERS